MDNTIYKARPLKPDLDLDLSDLQLKELKM